MRQIILDTETTGLYANKGHRLIEVGCLELVNRKLTGKHFHTYINPEREIESGAFTVHGITDEFLKDKPVFANIADDLVEFIKDAELIIHNAPFDVGFLNAELALMKHPCKAIADICRVIDTLIMARQIHTGQRNSLDALCKRYGIDNSHRELHGALLDAHLLARVYLAMTGGQSSLFEDLSVTDNSPSQQSHSVAVKTKVRNLPVIKASPEDLISHDKKLETMSGKSLWLESEEQS